MARWGDHDAAAGEERGPDFEGGGVEGVGGVHQDAVVVAGLPVVVGGEVDDVVVGVGDALGCAGRPGGVHDVDQLLGVSPYRRIGLGLVFPRRLGVVAHLQDGDVDGEAEVFLRSVGEQGLGGGILQDPCGAGGGLVGVQWYVGAACLEDGQA